MSIRGTCLVWFRLDLRMADNPALHAALQDFDTVIPIYIWEPGDTNLPKIGAASKWWLHHSLSALLVDLRKLESKLIIRAGPTQQVVQELLVESKAQAIYWNRGYDPHSVTTDATLKTQLLHKGYTVKVLKGPLLFEPGEIKNGSGGAYRVFTPFWKNCLTQAKSIAPPLPVPRYIPTPGKTPDSLDLNNLNLLPSLPWADGFAKMWNPGEHGARNRLVELKNTKLKSYSNERDRADRDGTSQLSPHLHFGEISPRTLWAELSPLGSSADSYLRQIAWREFAHHLLFHFPSTINQPLRHEFKNFPWIKDRKLLNAWQKGVTGYPMVDAGMRQLWKTGWMHNRVRMIVASFLVKHLLIPWQDGADWFWDTLVDADLANNSLGWQWVAGCGADAAPYFRIFNPVSQGTKFDPEGTYIRTWVPELASLDTQWIHSPWNAPSEVLDAAGVKIGKTYPKPIVDHAFARARALRSYEMMSSLKEKDH